MKRLAPMQRGFLMGACDAPAPRRSKRGTNSLINSRA